MYIMLYSLFWFSLVSISCVYMVNPQYVLQKLNELSFYLEGVYETASYQYIRVKGDTINYLVDVVPPEITNLLNIHRIEPMCALEDDEQEVDYIGFNNYDDVKELYIDDGDDRSVLETKKLMMIGLFDENKRYYRRIEDYSGSLFDVDFIYPSQNEEIFLQVEFELEEEKIDIHKKLDVFYVVGNRLFDRVFMKWFMHKYFNKKLEDDSEYKINIIDKYINMFTLEENERIDIIMKDNKVYYKKVVENIDLSSNNNLETE